VQWTEHSCEQHLAALSPRNQQLISIHAGSIAKERLLISMPTTPHSATPPNSMPHSCNCEAAPVLLQQSRRRVSHKMPPQHQDFAGCCKPSSNQKTPNTAPGCQMPKPHSPPPPRCQSSKSAAEKGSSVLLVDHQSSTNAVMVLNVRASLPSRIDGARAIQSVDHHTDLSHEQQRIC
jgi:FtsZ-interacting cell division protein ZipA